MIFTAQQIDQACQSGLFVYVGNRQKILGCDNGGGKHGSREVAPQGQAWVHHAGTLAWELVPLNSMVIIYLTKQESSCRLDFVRETGPLRRIPKRA